MSDKMSEKVFNFSLEGTFLFLNPSTYHDWHTDQLEWLPICTVYSKKSKYTKPFETAGDPIRVAVFSVVQIFLAPF